MEKCREDREMKRLKTSCIIWILPILIAGLSAGCVSRYDEEQKLRDLDFTVLDREDEPEELSAMIEEEKEHPFRMVYADQGQLYIAEGYGGQPTTGYSVAVRELYETEYGVYSYKSYGAGKGGGHQRDCHISLCGCAAGIY